MGEWKCEFHSHTPILIYSYTNNLSLQPVSLQKILSYLLNFFLSCLVAKSLHFIDANVLINLQMNILQ